MGSDSDIELLFEMMLLLFTNGNGNNGSLDSPATAEDGFG